MKRNSFAFVIFLILLASGCAAHIPANRSFEELTRLPHTAPSELSTLVPQRASLGRAVEVRFAQTAIMTENGPSRFSLLELPQRKDSAVLTVRSYLELPGYPGFTTRPEAFAPQVQLFDMNFTPIAAVIDPPVLHRTGYKTFYQLDVLAEPDARYLLVYTDPALMRQQLSLFKTQKVEEPTNTLVIYPYEWHSGINYTPTGDLELLVPGTADYRYIPREARWGFDLGTTFGGERLAKTTAGSDSIHAGSGVILTGTYQFAIADDARWGAVLGAGFLYHPADTPQGRAEINAWIAEEAFTYTSFLWRARLGWSVDISPEYEAPIATNSREFENAGGPFAMLEWRVLENVWLGLRLKDAAYIDENTKEELDASSAGLFVNLSF